MSSAALGEFDRIPIRIESAPRALPWIFVRGLGELHPFCFQMLIQSVKVIRRQLNVNAGTLPRTHARSACASLCINRKQTNRAAGGTSHTDHREVRGLVDFDHESKL